MQFRLSAPFEPAGDQPEAIEQLVEGLRGGRREQVLMGVTGSGKTFTMANVIQQLQRPALVLSHNKTLAAQLYSRVQGVLSAQRGELLRQLLRLLPARGVHPAAGHLHREGRLDQRGDRPHAAGDDQLAGEPAGCDRRGQRVVHLRLGLAGGLQGDDGRRWRWATCSTATRCWRSSSTFSTSGTTPTRRAASFACAAIRSRSGRATRSLPTGSSSGATRSSGCRSSIRRRGEAIDKLEQIYIYPAKHFVLPEERIHGAVDEIRKELRERLELFKSQGKLLEAQRLSARTRYDVEMMMEMGYCPGIENYSRPLSGPAAGRAAVHAVRFLPEGLSAVRRRVARDGAAGRGDVRRRPQPQGDARRARLPAAECARQSAAASSTSGASGSSRRSTCRRRRGRTSWSRRAAKSSSRSCGRRDCWTR